MIPDDVVAKVLQTKILGPTGMKGLAAIKNIVEKWSVTFFKHNTQRFWGVASYLFCCCSDNAVLPI